MGGWNVIAFAFNDLMNYFRSAHRNEFFLKHILFFLMKLLQMFFFFLCDTSFCEIKERFDLMLDGGYDYPFIISTTFLLIKLQEVNQHGYDGKRPAACYWPRTFYNLSPF